MRKDHLEAAEKGKLIKIQTFDTDKGKFLLTIRRYRGEIYMFKYLEGKLTESHNLSQMKAMEE